MSSPSAVQSSLLCHAYTRVRDSQLLLLHCQSSFEFPDALLSPSHSQALLQSPFCLWRASAQRPNHHFRTQNQRVRGAKTPFSKDLGENLGQSKKFHQNFLRYKTLLLKWDWLPVRTLPAACTMPGPAHKALSPTAVLPAQGITALYQIILSLSCSCMYHVEKPRGHSYCASEIIKATEDMC